ncbi:MAG TPA: hypothetical protein VF676_07305 [Flavobacterium sp.]|jgi:hypothetical protein
MKLSLKILVVGMLLVLTGILFQISHVDSLDSVFIGVGLLLEVYAIIQMIRIVFFPSEKKTSFNK